LYNNFFSAPVQFFPRCFAYQDESNFAPFQPQANATPTPPASFFSISPAPVKGNNINSTILGVFMANKNLAISASENTSEESAGRRSFMKGVVAGSVAAGTLASTVANAAPAQFAASGITLVAKARVPTAVLRLSFSQRKPPKIYEIQRTLEEIIRRTGCDDCGLGGIDVLLRLDEIVNPAERVVAIVEGEMLQR
jgi:hypothetical protein